MLKKIFVLTIIILFACVGLIPVSYVDSRNVSLNASSNFDSEPVFVWDPKVYDYGTIALGSSATKIFNYTNVGGTAYGIHLEIEEIHPTHFTFTGGVTSDDEMKTNETNWVEVTYTPSDQCSSNYGYLLVGASNMEGHYVATLKGYKKSRSLTYENQNLLNLLFKNLLPLFKMKLNNLIRDLKI